MKRSTIDNLVQGSPQWHDERRGVLTASVVQRLLTPTLKVAENDTARGIAATLIAERISGFTEETPMTSDMYRGVDAEPVARGLYSRHYARATEVGFMMLESNGRRLGYSPDGLVGDDGLIEVKAPRAKSHVLTILSGEVPAQYMGQLQCGLLVSGRKWIDYVSYCGGLPLFVKRVLPDLDWHAAITEAWLAFEANAEHIVADYESRVAGLPTTKRIDFNNVELRLA